MLVNALKTKRYIGATVLPLALMCLLITLSFTKFFINHNSKLSIGITIDLLFSIPLIHILLSTKSSSLKYSTALFFTAGVIIANLIIPKSDRYFLNQIKVWVIPVIEFCSVVFFIVKTRKILGKRSTDDKVNEDFYSVFKGVTTELMPRRLASIISAEISAFYYAFFNWRKPVIGDKSFTYHKSTGVIAFISVFIFMIIVETFAFHLLLAKFSTKIAWIVSIISIYAAVQAFGIAKSIIKRPIKIIEDRIIIPYGILAETTLYLDDILYVKNYNKEAPLNGTLKCISPFKKIEEPNIIIKLVKPYLIEGIYGSQKSFDYLLINVDEKKSFIDLLQKPFDSTTIATE